MRSATNNQKLYGNFIWAISGFLVVVMTGSLVAQTPDVPNTPRIDTTEEASEQTGFQSFDEEKPPEPVISDELAKQRGWTRLTPTDQVWVDKKNKRVIVGGAVCHREGPLEMFACPPHTKEYESVVVVYSKAFAVHAGLLAIGAKPGKPVTFVPSYVAASGATIEVKVAWRNSEGKQQQTRAQEWIRDSKTQQPMTHDWVFGGSRFWVDEETGERRYSAEGGDFICVSNWVFPHHV